MIGFQDNQRIIEDPYVHKLFNIFNELQAKKFKFEETNTFIETKGEKPELQITLSEIPIEQSETPRLQKGMKSKKIKKAD